MYNSKQPRVQSGPTALLWNASDPGFGSYATASWPPVAAPDGRGFVFEVPRAEFCTDISAVLTDGTSCLDGHTMQPTPGDKVTAHIRMGYTLHILNSTRITTRHSAIHGAPGFAITEYDGPGEHAYSNVSVGRRRGASREALCGKSNPTGGRLCLGLISSNNDALHSSGCRTGPTFDSGEVRLPSCSSLGAR